MASIYNMPATKVIGLSNNGDDAFGYKTEVAHTLESYQGRGVNVTGGLQSIITDQTAKSEFISDLVGSFESDTSLTSAECASDAWYSNYAPMVEQLIDNSLKQVALESAMTGYAPIVSYNPFFIKRQWVSCVMKDVLLAEVPTSPVINLAYERRYLKDGSGNEYEIPNAFFDKDLMASLTTAATGLTFKTTAVNLPIKNTNVLSSTYVNGTPADGAELTPNFRISKVYATAASNGTIGTTAYHSFSNRAVPCNITVDITTHNFVNGKIKIPVYGVAESDGAETTTLVGYLEEELVGNVNFETGSVTVMSTGSTIVSVVFAGNVSNRFNNRSLESIRRVEQIQKVMPESGPRLNTAVTIEDAADALALQKIDVIADHCDIMGRTMAEMEDYGIRAYLDEKYTEQSAATTGPFGYNAMTVSSSFDVVPPEGYAGGVAQWMKDSREFIERTISALITKLNTENAIIVIVAHPNSIRYFQDGITWVFANNTEISGIKLNYNFGVMTSAQNKIHVVTSMYIPESDGLKFLVIPTTQELVTFKHYKYATVIDRNYRNPKQTLVPNIMVTQRTLTFDVLPVQGKMEITGRSLVGPTTYKRS